MTKNRFSPDDLRVASPCTASWEGMTGDERARLCGLCDLRVYNVSALTREEVASLVANAEGRLCLRLYRRADGTVLTRDCPVGLRAVRRRVARGAGAVLAALVGLCSSVFAQTQTRKDDKACPTVSTLKVRREPARDRQGVFGGVIADPLGAVIPGAVVTLTDEETKQKVWARTDDEGRFKLPVEKGGRYTVEVEVAGFPKYTVGNVELKAAESARADLTLTPDVISVTMGVIAIDYEDRSPVRTRGGTTTINVDALRGVRPRD